MSSNVHQDGELVQDEPLEIRMQMFDELPSPLRRALAEAGEDYSVYQVYSAWRNNRHTVEYMEKAIRGEL